MANVGQIKVIFQVQHISGGGTDDPICVVFKDIGYRKPTIRLNRKRSIQSAVVIGRSDFETDGTASPNDVGGQDRRVLADEHRADGSRRLEQYLSGVHVL